MLVCIIALTSGACQRDSAADMPAIAFTKVPEADDGGPDKIGVIEGRVTGARPGHRIVLFAKSGGLWWIQPLTSEPFTAIQADATWKNSTHLGQEYAAILVSEGYVPPARLTSLPSLGDTVAAVATVTGTPSSTPRPPVKTLTFSGYEWTVRSASSNRGGRANRYDPENAWTDANGALHLRIAKRGDAWTCAEVSLTRSFGYGTYVFVVRDTSQLEPSNVLGMFTWDDAGTDLNYREMDVEISRWGDPDNMNAQYVVQPFYVAANVGRFAAPAGVLTHAFRWEPGRVAFSTVRGAGHANAPTARRVFERAFTSGVPTPGHETVRMNLYIFARPSEATPALREAEVVIEKFEYLP